MQLRKTTIGWRQYSTALQSIQFLLTTLQLEKAPVWKFMSPAKLFHTFLTISVHVFPSPPGHNCTVETDTMQCGALGVVLVLLSFQTLRV